MNKNIEQELDLLRRVDTGKTDTQLSDVYERLAKRVQERIPSGIAVSIVALLLVLIAANISVSRRIQAGDKAPKDHTEMIDLIPNNNFYEGGRL